MPEKGSVPDAWDDDWESLADKQETSADTEPVENTKLSKAERKAKHVELNRQIWETADKPPEPMLFLQARDNVPLQSAFKPNVTVLSRKPPQVLSRNGATAGVAGLKLEDGDDSEEERRKKAEEDFAERKARAERERVEKQRKYAEARERLFGSPAPSSGESRGVSPNKQTPMRGKGRGRGGRDSQPRSSNEQSPARPAASGKLYDPSYSPKPNSVYIQKRETSNSRPGTPNDLQQPIREPRGPQPIGRGGRGFAPRGNHSASSV